LKIDEGTTKKKNRPNIYAVPANQFSPSPGTAQLTVFKKFHSFFVSVCPPAVHHHTPNQCTFVVFPTSHQDCWDKIIFMEKTKT